MRQTHLQLPEELLETVDAHCQRTGQSRSEVVREAIERYLVAARDRDTDPGDQAAKRLIAAEPW